MNEREEFERAWNNRAWILEKESDKDRAWRWWQARALLDIADSSTAAKREIPHA
jgi:hypothetical protein